MKKLFICITLLFVCTLQVYATNTAEIIRAFPYGNSLYAYISMDIDTPITTANGTLDSTQLTLDSSLYTVQQAGSPVEYMLFIDNSGSISAYAQDIIAFAQELEALSGEATCFTIATFGDEFSLLAEEISAGEVVTVIESIQYNAYTTQLYTGMQEAIDYFEGKPRTGSELRSLVVLSDAIETADSLVLDNVKSSDVMLHLVGFGDDEAALNELGTFVEATGGLYQVLGDDLTATQGAQAIHEELSSLHVLYYSLSGVSLTQDIAQLTITFSSEGTLVAKATAQVDLSQVDLSQDATESAVPSIQQEEPTQVEVQPETTTETATQSETPSTEVEEAPVAEGEEPTAPSQSFLLPAIIGGGILIVILTTVLIKSLKRK